MTRSHVIELPELEPTACLEHLAQIADDWGASWQPAGRSGGRLVMPVVAGVRQGMVAGQVSVEALDRGSRLTYYIEEEHYAVQKRKVVVLLLALFGALSIMAAPLVPALVPLVPLGAMLMLGAWLFIISGLRNSGPEELLGRLAEGVEEDGKG